MVQRGQLHRFDQRGVFLGISSEGDLCGMSGGARPGDRQSNETTGATDGARL